MIPIREEGRRSAGHGILDFLLKSLRDANLTVGTYTGSNPKSRENQAKDFVNGKLDVLIGSQSLATGIDDLQNVCSNMIINLLPMTNAEYRQLVGRIVREGQDKKVNIFIPVSVDNQRSSFILN